MKTKRPPLICMMSPLSQTSSERKVVRLQPTAGKPRRKLFSQPRSPVTDLRHESSRVMQSKQSCQQQQKVLVKRKSKAKHPTSSENTSHSNSLPKDTVRKGSKVKSKELSKKMPARKRQKSFGDEPPVTSPIRLSASATLCHSTKCKRQKMSVGLKEVRKPSPAIDSGIFSKHQCKNLIGTACREEPGESEEEKLVNRFLNSKRLERLLSGSSRNGSRKSSEMSGDEQDLHSVQCNGTGAKHRHSSPKPQLRQTMQQAGSPQSGEVGKSNDGGREAPSNNSVPVTTEDQNKVENIACQSNGILEDTQGVASLESVHAGEGDGLTNSQNSCTDNSPAQTRDKKSNSTSRDELLAMSQTQEFSTAVSRRNASIAGTPQTGTGRPTDEKTADPCSSSQSLFSDPESENETDEQELIKNKVNDDVASQASQAKPNYGGNSDMFTTQGHAYRESDQRSETSQEGEDVETIRGGTSTSEDMHEMQTKSFSISAKEAVNTTSVSPRIKESLNDESRQTVWEEKQNEQSIIMEDDQASDMSSFLSPGSPREPETDTAVRSDDQTPTIRETGRIQNGGIRPSLTPTMSGVESSFTALGSSCASSHLTPGQRQREGTESEDSDCGEREEIEAGQSHVEPIDKAAAVHLESWDMAEEKEVGLEDGECGSDPGCSLSREDRQKMSEDTEDFQNCETSPAVQESLSSKGKSADQDHGGICRRINKDKLLFVCYCHRDFAVQIVETLQMCPHIDHDSLLRKCDQSVVQIRGKFKEDGGQHEIDAPSQTMTIKAEEDSDREQVTVDDSRNDMLWGSKDRETYFGSSDGVCGKDTEQCISEDNDRWIAMTPDKGQHPHDNESSKSEVGTFSPSSEDVKRVPLLVPDGRGVGGNTMTLFISKSDLGIINQQMQKVSRFMYGQDKVESSSTGMLFSITKNKNTDPCLSDELHHLAEGGKKLKKKERTARKIKKGKKKGANVESATSRRVTDGQSSFSVGSSVVHPGECDSNHTLTDGNIEHNGVEIAVNKMKKKKKSKKDPSDSSSTCLKVKSIKKKSTESSKEVIKSKMKKSMLLADTSSKVNKIKSKEKKKKEQAHISKTLLKKSLTDSSNPLKKKNKQTKTAGSKKSLPKGLPAGEECAIKDENEAAYFESHNDPDVRKSLHSSKSKTKKTKEKTKGSKTICHVMSGKNKDKKTKKIIRTTATEKIKSKKKKKVIAEHKDIQVVKSSTKEKRASVQREPKSGGEGKFGRDDDCGTGDTLIISNTVFKRRGSNRVFNSERKSSGDVGMELMSDDAEQSEGHRTAEMNGKRTGQKAGLSQMQQNGKAGNDSKEGSKCGKQRLKKDRYVDPVVGDLSEWVERWLSSPVSSKGSQGGKRTKAKDLRVRRKNGKAGGSKGNTPDISANTSVQSAVTRVRVGKKEKKKEKKLEVRRGSLRGVERKSNERRWQKLSQDQEEVAAQKTSQDQEEVAARKTTKPKSTCNAVTCHTFKSAIDNHLKQLKRGSNKQKGPPVLDEVLDSDSSLDSFIDFVSFPDVFPAEESKELPFGRSPPAKVRKWQVS